MNRTDGQWRSIQLSFVVLMLLAGSNGVAQKVVRELDAVGNPFEVATVRPANREDGRHWFGVKVDASGRFQASAMPLNGLVYWAYVSSSVRGNVQMERGAPKWITSDQFDVQAKISDADMRDWGKLSYEQQMDRVRPMVRRLLTERFGLKLLIEDRPTQIYALVQAKGGAHVQEVPAPSPVQGDPGETAARWMSDNPGKAFQGQIMCSGDKCIGHAVKISDAVGQIAGSSQADRMVFDETGLKSFYDFSFPTRAQEDETPMQAVADGLGMRFEPRTAPIRTYIIESADHPSLDGAGVGLPHQ